MAPASLDGHYALTDAPSVFDQLTIFSLSILHQISNIIGVNLAYKLSEAMSSEDPPFFTTLGLHATKTSYDFADTGGGAQSWRIWQVAPTNPTDDVVIAVHGGAFTSQPNMIQWLDYAQTARDTGLAETRPNHMVLISPALSGNTLFTDPNVALIDDPVNGVPDPSQAPDWQGDLPDTGPGAKLWDPTQGSAADLPSTAIYVGTRDIVAPSEMTIAGRMAEAGSPVDAIVGVGQLHDWALGGIPTSSQAPRYRGDTYLQLGLTDDSIV